MLRVHSPFTYLIISTPAHAVARPAALLYLTLLVQISNYEKVREHLRLMFISCLKSMKMPVFFKSFGFTFSALSNATTSNQNLMIDNSGCMPFLVVNSLALFDGRCDRNLIKCLCYLYVNLQ